MTPCRLLDPQPSTVTVLPKAQKQPLKHVVINCMPLPQRLMHMLSLKVHAIEGHHKPRTCHHNSRRIREALVVVSDHNRRLTGQEYTIIVSDRFTRLWLYQGNLTPQQATHQPKHTIPVSDTLMRLWLYHCSLKHHRQLTSQKQTIFASGRLVTLVPYYSSLRPQQATHQPGSRMQKKHLPQRKPLQVTGSAALKECAYAVTHLTGSPA